MLCFSVHEGYGNDSDKTLDAFPFSQSTGKEKDEDAELRRQLRGMGKGKTRHMGWEVKGNHLLKPLHGF